MEMMTDGDDDRLTGSSIQRNWQYFLKNVLNLLGFSYSPDVSHFHFVHVLENDNKACIEFIYIRKSRTIINILTIMQ